MNIPTRKSGFALISTLSIMLLIVLLLVALLSLASTTTRSQSDGKAKAEAQANAKLALMLALGDLQKHMGPDQRISANGEILGDPESSTPTVANPHWTGVWDSWVTDPTNASVNPDYPSEASHHQTIGNQPDDSMHPAYDQKDKHFRKWLLSLNPSDAAAIGSAQSLTLDGKVIPGKADRAVRLVGEGTLGDGGEAKDHVTAGLISVADPTDTTIVTGRLGWWAGDESQKARIMADSYDASATLTDADRIFRSQAPGSMGNKSVPGLETLSNEEQLNKMASFKTLDILELDTPLAEGEPSISELNFHTATISSRGVLADVREGGLKRDLSTLLERPIDRSEDGDEFMLYAMDDPRFSDRSHSRVPIQDLAAYYQLHNHVGPTNPGFGVEGREGVRFDSPDLADSIQISAPDFDGGSKDRNRVLREYTTLYRSPVVTKVQFMIGITSEEITPADRQHIIDQIDPDGNGPQEPAIKVYNNHNATMPISDGDTHKLRMGIMPMVTLWNPNNVPMVMDDDQIFHITNAPPIIFRWRKYLGSADDFHDVYSPFNLSYLTAGGGQLLNGAGTGFPFLGFTLAAPGGTPIVFEPGEVKIFSVADGTGTLLTDDGKGAVLTGEFNEGAPYRLTSVNFLPDRFFKFRHSTTYDKNRDMPHVFVFAENDGRQPVEATIVFNANDRLDFWVDHDNVDSTHWAYSQRVAAGQSRRGAAFSFHLTDPRFRQNWREGLWIMQNYAFMSRHGGGGGNATRDTDRAMVEFNDTLIAPGFPGGITPMDFEGYTNSIPGSRLIGAGDNDEVIGLMDFSITLGCEASVTGGYGGGRRIASRPFIHSGLGAPPFIDQSNAESLYNYGWSWRFDRVNDIYDSSTVQADPGTDNGYFGGGYTIEAGTTHVVQREIPVLPPISIASLSHAHLGGFSIAYATIWGDEDNDPATYTLGHKSSVPHPDGGTQRRYDTPWGVDFQKTIANGMGGLAPHVTQAIGNSYAHPNVAASKAIGTWTRHFDGDEAEIPNIPFVDHSYLANKAIWDDYFFSSISPQRDSIPLYGSTGRIAKQVANDFFQLSGSAASIPLPNRRIRAYTENLDQIKLDSLFTEADIFSDGLADKIAAHLMVDGAFNINSTSVDAWKVFLSSLKGKPVAYFDGGKLPREVATQGVAINPGSLPNDPPVTTADILSPSKPPSQWTAGRELTVDEIDQLAKAIVKQVKLRGPFLSLSEFINRRLDTSDPGLSVKGALQAALDDTDVPINAVFRVPTRMLDGETASISGFKFPDAAKGPIAYGSTPYVDQADVLRHFSEQITPRGDTFVIRTYGDSLDASGNVTARAWCEAVVQRFPDYCDPADEAHEKQSELTDVNKVFGRKLQIISFRWLDSNEV